MPAEFLNGNTGANCGKLIQAWDADFFGAVFFGMFGVKMLSEDSAQIMPRIADTQSFDTGLALRFGVLRITQTAGSEKLQIEIKSPLDREIRLRYGAMTSKKAAGSREERVGDCVFQVVELSLGAGEKRTLVFEDSSRGAGK